MDKQVVYFGKTEQGVFAQALFGSAGAFEKTAGAPPFSDWETGDELRRFLKTVTKDDRKRNVYVLVNALGAGEFFGPNVNADYFPWDALAHEGDDFGYRTFLRAHAYQHHANKDPTRAFGIPVVSVLNPSMKRVELIIRLDREKAKAENADGIISRVEKGEFPDVSMGCKVPFDVCSICGNKSKTRDDYCKHMRPPAELRDVYGPNKILPDGRKICVHNLTPRFFDISFVFIGADKTAKVMAKLASKGSQVCIGNVCAVPAGGARAEEPVLYDARGEELRKVACAEPGEGMRGACGRLCSTCPDQPTCHMDKLAAGFGVKTSSEKLSEIVKNVPSSSFSMKTLPKVERNEKDISKEDLDILAQKRLADSLGAITRLGMVLKPHEFQRLVLKRMGEDERADDLDEKGHVFRQVPEFDTCPVDVERGDPLDRVFAGLKRYVRQRTVLGRPFQIRVIIAGQGAHSALPTRRLVEDALLDKVSAAYNGYRRNVLKKLSSVVREVESDPRLREAVLGEDLLDMSKTASSAILSPDSVQYLMGAHLQDRSLLSSNPVAKATMTNYAGLLVEPNLA